MVGSAKKISLFCCAVSDAKAKRKIKYMKKVFIIRFTILVIRCKHRALPEMCKRYVSFGDVSYDTKDSNLMGGRRPLRRGIPTIFRVRVPSMECCRSPSRRQYAWKRAYECVK